MKQLILPVFALSVIAAPLTAQQEEDGLSLMEQGTRMFLRGLMTEMEPALRELDEAAREMEPYLRDFATQMGPALADLMDQIDDWTLYEAPEILENGDIILRRKVPLVPKADPAPDTAPESGAQTDL